MIRDMLQICLRKRDTVVFGLIDYRSVNTRKMKVFKTCDYGFKDELSLSLTYLGMN